MTRDDDKLNDESRNGKPMVDEDITDVMLMAYVDGDPELPAEQRRLISRRLPQSPELVRRMLDFHFTLGPMSAAYDGVMDVPESLRTTVAGPAAARRTNSHAARTNFIDRLARWRMPMWAIAAAAAILLAGATGLVLRDARPQDLVTLDQRGVIATGAFGYALETAPAGRQAAIGGGVTMKPKLTFAGAGPGSGPDASKRWCREFEMRYSDNQLAIGLACRIADATWRVLLRTDAEPAPPPGRAVGPDRRDPQDPEWLKFENYRDDLRQGNTLTAEDEAALIGQRWQRKP